MGWRPHLARRSTLTWPTCLVATAHAWWMRSSSGGCVHSAMSSVARTSTKKRACGPSWMHCWSASRSGTVTSRYVTTPGPPTVLAQGGVSTFLCLPIEEGLELRETQLHPQGHKERKEGKCRSSLPHHSQDATPVMSFFSSICSNLGKDTECG